VPPIAAGAREDRVVPEVGCPVMLVTGALKPAAMDDPCPVAVGVAMLIGLAVPPDPDTPDEALDEPPIPVLAAGAPPAPKVKASVRPSLAAAAVLDADPVTPGDEAGLGPACWA
jgi:hypothetical protein